MRILVFDAAYPHAKNLGGDVFVHVRVKRYIELGHDVHVVVFFTGMSDYVFDGVAVTCVASLGALQDLIAKVNPDVLAIHFFQGWMLKKILRKTSVPAVVWVHGMEALMWYRRLFNFAFTREFLDYVRFNVIQIARFRQLVSYAGKFPGRVRFVFVSEWMRKAAERDALRSIPAAVVIPNPIDTDRFPYIEKNSGQRLRVLLIRSFNSRKYANDIAVDAIHRLSERPEFSDFEFSIHGAGQMFESLTGGLRKFANVSVVEGFIDHAEVARLHAAHGVFLCPTRQDSQGVSMCEAMASGLVPVTSRNTAIPEFVTDGRNGFLGNSSEDIVNALLTLRADSTKFDTMSRNAALDIRAKCAVGIVADAELAVMAAAAGEGP